MGATKASAKARKRHRAPDDTPGDPMIPLIRKARQQIEAEPGGPLGWLVRFVREDPDTWLPGDVEAHGYRLLAFVYPHLSEKTLALGEPIPPITPYSVEEIHDELRGFFHELVSAPVGQGVTIPTDDLVVSLWRTADPGKKPAAWGRGRGGPRRTLLYQEVAELVFRQDRLIACPQCSRPFLALRKKKFCTLECLQTWWDAKRSKKGGAR